MSDTTTNGAIVPADQAAAKRPMSAVAVSVGNRGVQITTMDEMARFASAVARSGLAPKGMESPEAVMVAIQFGLELGMPPMAAMRSVYVVNNRPTLWGDMMLALCMGSPSFDFARFREWTDGEGDQLVAHCVCGRRGATEVKRSFSMVDAKKAGLADKNLYRAYPRRMCQYRARAFALRDTFPDVLQGVHAAEEMMRDEESPFEADQASRSAPVAKAAELTQALKATSAAPAANGHGRAKAPPATPEFTEADVEVHDPPFKATDGGAGDEGLPSLARARDAIALWAESSGRDVPNVHDMDMALERYALAIRFGPIKDWIEDPDRVAAFVERARSTTVVWARYLRSESPS